MSTSVASTDRHDVLGTCHHDCPDSCGWITTVEHGRAVALRGNPDHPYSAGELCPKVNRLVRRVYAPDRILTPLIRTGPKGASEFRPASWDEALSLVAERVGAVIDEHGGEAVLPWNSAGTQGLIQMSSLDRPFFAALGSSRGVGSVCGLAARSGFSMTYGSGRGADPSDLRHAELVLLWGTNTRLTNRHLWPVVEDARAAGAEIVVIDPMRTITADAADWFIQPLPGTDTALVLGMLHVLVRDGFVDHDYVAQYSTGFDELARHVATWTPERAGAACGLEPDTIERLARRYGEASPAFIRTLIGAEHHEHGARFFRALGCLPVVTGSWRHLGGGLARSVGSWADVAVDDSVFDAPHDTRTFHAGQLGRTLTEADPAIHALFVWCGNPVVSHPQSELIRRGLARDDLFTVVSEQFLTDTAAYADVVFPATTQIENLDVIPAWGHLYLGWNEPAIEPLGEAVPNTELWRRLAAAMHIDDERFTWSDEELIGAALHDIDVEELRSTGFVRLPLPDPLLPYAEGGFATPSARAELWAGDLDPVGAFVPDHMPTIEGADGLGHGEYPLVLLTPKLHVRFLNTTYSRHHGELESGPFVELDAVDASARGLGDGDVVRVYNDRGELHLPLRIGDRVRPGVAIVPWGWWGAAQAVNALTNDAATDCGSGVAYLDTRVEVAPVTPA